MPRAARIFVENACYHVLVRGVQKDNVFRGERDYKIYTRLLHKYKVKFGCLIYAYCLMPNHVHIVLEAPRGVGAMSSFMHGLNHTYAMIFNGKYERVGHLWQNRYKNYVVLKDIYLMNLISYVEMNPVRAGLVSLPESYVWSSYRSRVLGKQNMVLDRIENICSNEEAAVGTGLKLNL